MKILFHKHNGGWLKRLWEGGPYDDAMLQYDDQRYLMMAPGGRIDMLPRIVFANEWDYVDVSDLDPDTVWLATLYETGTRSNINTILAELLGVKLFWNDSNSLYRALTK